MLTIHLLFSVKVDKKTMKIIIEEEFDVSLPILIKCLTNCKITNWRRLIIKVRKDINDKYRCIFIDIYDSILRKDYII